MQELENMRNRDILFLGGGGFKALAYVGFLSMSGYEHFSKIGGVSAGGIAALLICAGFGLSDLLTISLVNETVLQNSFSITPSRTPLRLQDLRDNMERVLIGGGISVDTTFEQFRLISKADFVTFAFCLPTNRVVSFSADTTPHVKVLDAVMASICLPYIFEPVVLDEMAYCDAGIITGNTLQFFDAQRTVALVVRQDHLDKLIPFPQTIFLRCSMMTNLCVSAARTQGMLVLCIPRPFPSVSLLSTQGAPPSAFLDTGKICFVLYVARAIFTGVLVLVLCSPWSCGPRPQPGRTPSSFSI